MEKALLISEDVVKNMSGRVLVTFRGVAVDENVVRYAQQRACDLGFQRAGTLHALLLRETAMESYVAVVRARIGARRYERCARARNAMSALKLALDTYAAPEARVEAD